ncbi:sensor histidine kinase [Myroides sp. LJL116]
MRIKFKTRKRLHYGLLISIVFLQLLLGVIIYNEIFYASKLEDLEADMYISEQASYFSDLTQENYLNAQKNLQKYIHTKEIEYLNDYNDNLDVLNASIENLFKIADKSKLFSFYLTKTNDSPLYLEQVSFTLDSLRNIRIAPLQKNAINILKLDKFKYSDIVDSIQVESYLVVDSVQRKGLLSRLGRALSGKVDIQKEQLNTVLTLKQGGSITTGSIDEQLTLILDKANDYYQDEFSRFKNKVNLYNIQDQKFIDRSSELLSYSSLLLKKYNQALLNFTSEARKQFYQQYDLNKKLRVFSLAGVILIMIIISVSLIYLTTVTFEYEKRLIKEQKKTLDSLKFKNRIVSMISHEIRSPLNTISIYSKIFGKKVSSPELQEYIETVSFTTNSLLLLSNQILDYSKNEHSKPILNRSVFNLKTELEGILKSLSTFVESNKNNFKVKNFIEEDLYVDSDVVKIYQLFYNIVGNANKFTHQGIIEIVIHQQNTIEENKLKLVVEIRDNGVGISEEDLQHVFDNFHQGVNECKFTHLGIGLGLNLCKEIVELFDGEISIESEKNKQTIVTFSLFIDKASSK